MSIRFKEIKKEEYETLVEGKNLPLTQNAFYGEWQIAMGKKVGRFSIDENFKTIGVFQVVKTPMVFGKSYLYIPHGPFFLEEPSDEFEEAFNKLILRLLVEEQALFLRFDPTWSLRLQVNFSHVLGALDSKLVPKYLYDGSFQPKYEWVLDLSKSEDELLAGMKKVNRYTIRQAERLGATVEIVNNNFAEYFDRFYDLISKTAERDGFSHYPKKYYKKIFAACEKEKNAFLAVARYDGKILLVNLLLKFGDTVYFLFSGSDDFERRVGYTYLAQWEAIKESKRLGFKIYNFGGYAPENCKYIFYKKWLGFSDFKRRFGGRMVEYSDFYDVVNNSPWYYLYKTRRSLFAFWRKIV